MKSLIATTASSGRSGKSNSSIGWFMLDVLHGTLVRSGSVGDTASGRGVGPSEDLQVELLVQSSDLALGCAHEQLPGHGDADAVVAGGVIDEGVLELASHEAGVASAFQQVIQAGEQFLA